MYADVCLCAVQSVAPAENQQHRHSVPIFVQAAQCAGQLGHQLMLCVMSVQSCAVIAWGSSRSPTSYVLDQCSAGTAVLNCHMVAAAQCSLLSGCISRYTTIPSMQAYGRLSCGMQTYPEIQVCIDLKSPPRLFWEVLD